jgi:hypothetical protein
VEDFNGAVRLRWVSTAQARLAPSLAAGDAAAQHGLSQALAAARPTFDFGVAWYLAEYGLDAYAGASALELVRGYAQVPHYERGMRDLVVAATWLASRRVLPVDEMGSLLSRLYQDPKASLGARLLVEEVQYDWRLVE